MTAVGPIASVGYFPRPSRPMSWLAGSGVALDGKGFVHTGTGAGPDRGPMETSRRGVFAIGDVRAGSVKRVAAAVGEGAQVVAALHGFLADETSQPANVLAAGSV